MSLRGTSRVPGPTWPAPMPSPPPGAPAPGMFLRVRLPPCCPAASLSGSRATARRLERRRVERPLRERLDGDWGIRFMTLRGGEALPRPGAHDLDAADALRSAAMQAGARPDPRSALPWAEVRRSASRDPPGRFPPSLCLGARQSRSEQRAPRIGTAPAGPGRMPRHEPRRRRSAIPERGAPDRSRGRHWAQVATIGRTRAPAGHPARMPTGARRRERRPRARGGRSELRPGGATPARAAWGAARTRAARAARPRGAPPRAGSCGARRG